MSTIKDRLLADLRGLADARGRVHLNIFDIALRHGLNGHDATKNLDQLRKAGLVTFRWAEHRRPIDIRVREPK